MKLATLLIALMLTSCAGWDVAPAIEYMSRNGESVKASVRIKVPKNSNK